MKQEQFIPKWQFYKESARRSVRAALRRLGIEWKIVRERRGRVTLTKIVVFHDEFLGDEKLGVPGMSFIGFDFSKAKGQS